MTTSDKPRPDPHPDERRWFEQVFDDDDPELQKHVRVSMYADGLLSDEEATAFERELVNDPDLQAELEDMMVLAALADEVFETAPEPVLDRSRARPRPTARLREWAARMGNGLRRALVALPVAAACVTALIIKLWQPPAAPLAVDVVKAAATAYRSTPSHGMGLIIAQVGSKIRLSAAHGESDYALRVYPPAGLGPVRACPGDPACTTEGNRVQMEIELEDRGTYEIIWVDSPRDVPPTTGDFDLDLERIPADVRPDTFRVESQ